MLKWKRVNSGFGFISYTTKAGGLLGSPDAYPTLYARIDRVEKYDNKGKKFYDFVALGSIGYFEDNFLNHITLEYTAHSLRDAEHWVEKQFEDFKKNGVKKE